MLSFLKYIVVLYSLSTYVKSEPQLQKQSEILDQILSDRYDPRIRPAGNSSHEPVIDHINLFVRRLTLNENDASFQVQLTFRQQWNDQRLKYENLDGKIRSITLTDPKKLWLPDAFFANEIKSYFHDMTSPNVLLRIYPDGNVLYSMRITLRLSCPMPHRYSGNFIACSIVVVSYGYTTEDLIFKWKESDPVQVVKNLYLPNFSLIKFDTTTCASKTNTGEYSCLRMDFIFRREHNYYVITVYLPSSVLVILTWIAFWLDVKAPLMRITFTAIPFLCMVVLSVALVNILPQKYFVTTISVWTGTCFAFILAAFILVAFVNNMRLQERDKMVDDITEIAEAEMEMKSLEQQNDVGRLQPKPNDVAWYRVVKWNSYPQSKRVDVIARIVFPVLFAIFCLISFV